MEPLEDVEQSETAGPPSKGLIIQSRKFRDDAIYLYQRSDFKKPTWLCRVKQSTLYRRDGTGFGGSSFHFNDNLQTMTLRVRRSVDVASAYDRDPAPRIRRMISNVVVHEGENAGEYAVTSAIALFRNRFDIPTCDILTAKREDIIRRTDAGLRIAKRTILLD